MSIVITIPTLTITGQDILIALAYAIFFAMLYWLAKL